jgi:hypothetical protein
MQDGKCFTELETFEVSNKQITHFQGVMVRDNETRIRRLVIIRVS